MNQAQTKNLISKHPLFHVYHSMKKRCYNKNSKDYKHYGDRGITVCDRWLESFWNFVEDMGERPFKHSLDRINNNGNYEPSNCKWSTQEQQVGNSRKCKDARGFTIYTNKSGNTYYIIQYKRKAGRHVKCFKTEIEAREFYESIKNS